MKSPIDDILERMALLERELERELRGAQARWRYRFEEMRECVRIPKRYGWRARRVGWVRRNGRTRRAGRTERAVPAESS